MALAATAICSALGLLALGGLGTYLAVRQYAWANAALHSTATSGTLHIGVPLIALEQAAGLLWLLATPAWLILAIAKRHTDRDRRTTNYLVGSLLLALVAIAVIAWSASADAWQTASPLELWTPSFIRALLLAGTGLCAIAATAWVLLPNGRTRKTAAVPST
jgi:hypothetical protein